MSQSDNKRIAKNTMMLYIRQILIMLVSLYTVRVVLDVLGVEDYGVYNVVGGVVAFFSFLSGAMASATQRFFSFALGEKDDAKLRKVFSTNIVVYCLIAIFIAIVLETVGLWFVANKLKIPPERYDAVLIVYHFSVLTFMANIFRVPFMAILIAHEDMHTHALVSVVEVMLKLLVVYILYIAPLDKLALYSGLIFVVSLLISIIYICICFKKYQECQIKKLYLEKNLLKEILSFTGWDMFLELTTVARNQGVTILLNQFFNPIIVAARTVAINISGRVNVFSGGFNTSLYPPIIKAYAKEDRQRMFALIFNGSKMTFFLMWVFVLPMVLHMDAILAIWLKEVPPYAVLFSRLALGESLIVSLCLPMVTAVKAHGKVRKYNLTLGFMQILIFAIDWFILSIGAPAYMVFVVAIAMNALMLVARLVIVRGMVKFPVGIFMKEVIWPLLLVVVLSSLCAYGFKYIILDSIIFTIVSIGFSMLVTTCFTYLIALNKQDRLRVVDAVKDRLKR